MDKDYPEDVTVVTREQWGAKPSQPVEDEPLVPLKTPVKKVYFNDTASYMCDNLEECVPLVQRLQNNHMECDYADITHNFLIGTDGTIYVGRGWDFEPDGMMEHYKGSIVDIAYIGNFERLYPTPSMLEIGEKLVEHGVKINKISRSHKVIWFRDAM